MPIPFPSSSFPPSLMPAALQAKLLFIALSSPHHSTPGVMSNLFLHEVEEKEEKGYIYTHIYIKLENIHPYLYLSIYILFNRIISIRTWALYYGL